MAKITGKYEVLYIVDPAQGEEGIAALVEKMIEDARTQESVKQQTEEPEITPEDNQAVEDTAYFQARQRIMDMLSTLSQQEAKVLTLRFGLEGGLPQTPEQVGSAMGMAADEILAVEAAALLKLREQEK